MTSALFESITTKSFRIIANDFACVSFDYKQFRFPKSKKARIRKKWRRKSENFKTVETHKVLIHGDVIYMSTKTLNLYLAATNKQDNP
jgi:hypothetical protein